MRGMLHLVFRFSSFRGVLPILILSGLWPQGTPARQPLPDSPRDVKRITTQVFRNGWQTQARVDFSSEDEGSLEEEVILVADTVTGRLEPSERIIFEGSHTGPVVSRQHTHFVREGGAWVESVRYRTISTPVAPGRWRRETTEQVWEGTSWTNVLRRTTTTGEEAMPPFMLEERWHNGAWVPAHRAEVIRGGDDRIILREAWREGRWAPVQRQVFIDAQAEPFHQWLPSVLDEPDLLLEPTPELVGHIAPRYRTQAYTDGRWSDELRITVETTPDGQPSRATIQTSHDGHLTNERRFHYAYDAGRLHGIEEDGWADGAWTTRTAARFTYDDYGNPLMTVQMIASENDPDVLVPSRRTLWE